MNAIKNIRSKPLKEISFFSSLSDEAKKIMIDIKQLDDWFDTAQLNCTKTDGKTIFPLKFAFRICNKGLTVQEAKDNQIELKILINERNKNYNLINKIYIYKRDTLKTAKILLFIRKKIITAFGKDVFPYIDGFKAEQESDEESDEELDKELSKESNENKIFKDIESESEDINYELFEKHFSHAVPSALAKKIFETQDKNKNNEFVNLIKLGLCNLEDEIEKMSEDEKKKWKTR